MRPDLARISHRVEQLFDAAIDKKTAAEREAYLDGACGHDADVRARGESLLKAHKEAGGFCCRGRKIHLHGGSRRNDR